MDISAQRLLELIIFFPLFMIAITFHEAAHAYAAFRAGDPTAKLSGRLSLNPMVHIDPLGLLFFVLSSLAGRGFGWAKPVPVNPLNFKNYKKDDIIVSLAGVAANLVLMFLTLVLIKALYMAGIFDAVSGNLSSGRLQDYIHYLLLEFYFLNGILFVFNLLPIPPLDGSHVFIHLFFKDSMMVEAKVARYGFLILVVVLMTGILSFVLNASAKVMFMIASFFINL
ncbi:MAG: site-2 protease family protein [bacterium]